MHALGEQFLAGTALAGDQNRRIGLGVTLGEAEQCPKGGGITEDLFKTITCGKLAGAYLGANASVGALDDIGFLAGNDHAIRLALLHDGGDVGRQGFTADLDHPVLFTLAT
ncbi:hypothetical protein D3C80_1838840 [compost metagenome]